MGVVIQLVGWLWVSLQYGDMAKFANTCVLCIHCGRV